MTQQSRVFGRDYAAAYDDLYQDKDYVAECDLIERVFEMYGQGPTRRVLDLGCGTGGHAVILAKRGYDVVGVDRSPEMLAHARALGSSARFELGEIASVDLGETFDAALMMFAVLGYQVGNADVQVRYHAWRIEERRVVAEVREQHPMRYFFGLELELLLAAAGFELTRLGVFPTLDDEPTEQTWNVALVARAV